jgi:hypothetical protein
LSFLKSAEPKKRWSIAPLIGLRESEMAMWWNRKSPILKRMAQSVEEKGKCQLAAPVSCSLEE